MNYQRYINLGIPLNRRIYSNLFEFRNFATSWNMLINRGGGSREKEDVACRHFCGFRCYINDYLSRKRGESITIRWYRPPFSTTVKQTPPLELSFRYECSCGFLGWSWKPGKSNPPCVNLVFPLRSSRMPGKYGGSKVIKNRHIDENENIRIQKIQK